MIDVKMSSQQLSLKASLQFDNRKQTEVSQKDFSQSKMKAKSGVIDQMSSPNKASKVSQKIRERVKEFSAKIEREKMEQEVNQLYLKCLKNQKKYERSLAPMVFPLLERDKRKKKGFDYSEVSTPPSSALTSKHPSRIESRIEFQTNPSRQSNIDDKA